MRKLRRYALVLSVYLNTRGFAFVVFEGHLSPFDWGIREIRGPRKRKGCLTRIRQIVDRDAPDVLVIQDTSEHGTSRARWITTLNASIAVLAKEREISVFAYSRDQVRGAFERYTCPNKHGLAELVAKRIPALERYIPPPRKPWMSEDRRISLFDAAALGLVFFQSIDNEAGS
ncbi:hypothetical protein LUI11_32235 [Bradyrhizobium diazoefficiens]|uniref:Uncharacterized protein n=2 Tax=Bradyrhizobium diazoefficiens TaxID=1355477 RepID=A0A810AB47_9BRAD|nr:hypothetical protein [Bradyrhizobium diazoefficiens]APO49697.1 hypothetical protein BD122_05665 [Bradyrhizobium diazoefficiens]KGJ65553.1 hypothetical protein BJA5080_02199 [Bradyrhizobium diazoefficiens SEMIA 5080]KOY12359.1 hypothetical protein AF336_04310 [Bradyrhizobium diazoefficiens]MCD9296227.1 hypothetical protein [Bradyrhizobium diazoefficiens]MCD9813035.1 hypothetical protein [Bradyrhizobium diazoefficiens]